MRCARFLVELAAISRHKFHRINQHCTFHCHFRTAYSSFGLIERNQFIRDFQNAPYRLDWLTDASNAGSTATQRWHLLTIIPNGILFHVFDFNLKFSRTAFLITLCRMRTNRGEKQNCFSPWNERTKSVIFHSMAEVNVFGQSNRLTDILGTRMQMQCQHLGLHNAHSHRTNECATQ